MRVPIVVLLLLGGCLDRAVLESVDDDTEPEVATHTDVPAADTDSDRPEDTVVPADTDTDEPSDTDTGEPAADTVVPTDTDTGSPPPRDDDHDGWTTPVDCDDADATVHPGAIELCDGRTNDCDPAWTTASEDGHASFEASTGAWTDVTAAFPTIGPTSTTAWTAPGPGTLWLCAGTWHRLVRLAAGPAAVRGRAGPSLTTVDADGAGSVITASTGVVATIAGLTLREGATATSGAGIVAAGPSLRVEQCRVEDCTADVAGGGLAFAGPRSAPSEVVVTDTTFVRDVAGTSGGGADLALAAGTLTLTRVTFEDDGAVPTTTTSIVRGGGLRVAGVADVRIEDVTATGCTAGGPFATRAYGGGAHLAIGSGGTIAIVGSRFTDDDATGSGSAGSTAHLGGGLAVEGAAPLIVEDVTFEDDVAGVLGVPNARRGHGGGLYVDRATSAELRHVHFARDDAGDPSSGGNGGGLFVHLAAATSGSPSTLILEDATFAENSATGGGGADLRADVVRIERVVVTGNATTSGAGAGLSLDTPDGTIVEGTIEDNVATGGVAGGLSVHGEVTLSRTTVRGNRASSAGAMDVLRDATVHLVDGTSLSDNTVTYSGGAIGMIDGAKVECASGPGGRTEIVGNTATVNGSAISFYGATFVAVDCDLGEPGTPRDNVGAPGGEVRSMNGVADAAHGDGATFTCDDVTGCR